MQESGDPVEEQSFIYKMSTGYVVLINNSRFPKRADNEVWRHGSEIDAEKLRQFFEYELQFRFEEYKNQTAQQISKIAEQLAERDFKEDCFFFIVLSHGDSLGILGVDEESVAVDAITGCFRADICRSLRGKPKIFIIQACRGTEDDRGFVRSDASRMDRPGEVPRLPLESDFLIAYPCPPGYTAFRTEEQGTWFINALINVFNEFSDKEHLMDMFLRVNYMIAAKYFSSGDLKQMPCQDCRLTKKCFFRLRERYRP